MAEKKILYSVCVGPHNKQCVCGNLVFQYYVKNT